jgi:uncharacterized integral membrane protein (TIGR00698 family)
MSTESSGPDRSVLLCGLLCAGLAAAAVLLRPALGPSRLVPSPSVLALVLGLALALIPAVQARFASAAKTVSKAVIPAAIVLIGFGMDLERLLEGGAIGGTLLVVVAAMVVAFVGAIVAGRVCGLDPRAALLLGAGTAVCGNSAIMAVAPTVKAKEEDLGLAIGVINLLGVAMLFVLPPAAAALGVGGNAGGALAGLTVHAVPQAIATGQAFGGTAEEWATLFKLLRVAMLVPTVVLLAVLLRDGGGAGEGRKGVGVPHFVWLFVVASGLRATGWLDGEVALGEDARPLWGWLKQGGSWLLALALAAIGLTLNVPRLVRVGPRFLLAGVLAVLCMVAASLPMVLWLLG